MLVVRMDGIGDMMLFRESIDHYAEAFGVTPSDITVLGCESWAPIADTAFPGLRVIAINEHRFARNPGYRARVAFRVRRLAPAVAVCDQFFRRAMMADSLVWISGSPQAVVSQPHVSERTRAEFNWFLAQSTQVVDTGRYPTHELVRHARFVSAVLGRSIAPKAPRLAWPVGTTGLVPDGPPYVVLNPGSNEYGRRWPLANYVALSRRLLEAGLRVVFVGAPGEEPDHAIMAPARAQDGVIDLTGRTNLPQLIDTMAAAAAVVTNDTGPAHVAIALGTPTVVLVGGGHFGSFVPYPREATPSNARFVWHEMDCYHCFWQCPKRAHRTDSFPCVAAIGENSVWAALANVSRDRIRPNLPVA